MKTKFYYIDESGNKKKYVGKITENSNGTYNGLLTNIIKSDAIKDLTWHPEVQEVSSQNAYYSYTNLSGEEEMYFDSMKTDEEGNKYFTYTERNLFKLEYVPEVQEQEEYFTYLDLEGNEHKYSGEIIKKGNKYFGLI